MRVLLWLERFFSMSELFGVFWVGHFFAVKHVV